MTKEIEEVDIKDLPKMTKQDLDIYLNGIDKKMLHYKVEQQVRPNIYNFKMMEKLNTMADHAIYRFHNQGE